jgi:glycosyltransferase involved in cell wall biosynthesis
VNPAISVVIPAFNAEATLAGCLQSLAAQREPHPPFEIIVVDDGSDDGTARIAESFGVRLLRTPHRGAAYARNCGVTHSQGDILLFTDADCEPAPDWMQALSRPFEDPAVAGARGVYRSTQTSLVARFVQYEYWNKYRGLRSGQRIDFVDTYSAGYRKSIF